jgi:hypothetical protein
MQRHHRNAASRVGLGTLIVGIALSLMAFGMSPAQAAAPAAAAASPTTTQTASTPTGRPCGPGVNLRTAERCAITGPQQFSEGGCGFMQRCIYLSRSEQLTILAGAGGTIVALICGATALLGCAAASGIVASAFQWLSNRGGACPTSKPKLKIRYFPTPSIIGCVA